MDLRAACALAGAIVRSAVLAKAPRRTTAAVAAAAYAAAHRGLCSGAEAAPAAAGDGPAGAAPCGDGAAAARLWAARAAARSRRRAAKKERKQESMVVDRSGVVAEVEPTGVVEAPEPPLAVARAAPEPAAPLVTLSSPPAASPLPAGSASSGGAAPSSTLEVEPRAKEGSPSFAVDDSVVVVEGDFAGASGRVVSLDSVYAQLTVNAGAIFHDVSPITVALVDLVLQRCQQPGGAHARRRRGRIR